MPPKSKAAVAVPPMKSITSFFAAKPKTADDAKPSIEAKPAQQQTPAKAEPEPQEQAEHTASKKAPPKDKDGVEAYGRPKDKPTKAAPTGGLEFKSPPAPARAQASVSTVEKKLRPAAEEAAKEERKPKKAAAVAQDEEEETKPEKQKKPATPEPCKEKKKRAKPEAEPEDSPLRSRRLRAARTAPAAPAEEQVAQKRQPTQQKAAGDADDEEEYTGLEAIEAVGKAGEEGGEEGEEVGCAVIVADAESESEYSESSEEAASDSQASESSDEASGSEASGASSSGSDESDGAELVSEEEEAPRPKKAAAKRTPPARKPAARASPPAKASPPGSGRKAAGKRGRLARRAASSEEDDEEAAEPAPPAEQPADSGEEAEPAEPAAEAEGEGAEAEGAAEEEADGAEEGEGEGERKLARFAFTGSSGKGPGRAGGAKRSKTAEKYIAAQRSAPLDDEGRPAVSIAASRVSKFEATNQERYSWLLDERDESGRRPGEEGYDGSTLRVPGDRYAKLSDFEKQYWDIKKNNWDKIVFFKKGKFYELYEKDADVGHRELDLKLTDRVNMRMCGVPESGFDMWSAKLVAKGYKVVRVEQMERLRDADKRRAQGVGKESKVCAREVCAVLTQGTAVEEALIGTPDAVYLLALREARAGDGRRFGLCLVDTGRGDFATGAFDDDAALSALETLLLQLQPRELVYERANLSPEALRMLRRLAGAVVSETPPGRAAAAWSPDAARDRLRTGGYFAAGEAEEAEWPEALREAMGEPLAAQAFAGCLSYLREVMQDEALVSGRRFRRFDPRDEHASGRHLVLDGKALSNLELLESSCAPAVAIGAALDAGAGRRQDGSLLGLLDRTVTPFGRRLLRAWLCAPLRRREAIEERLDAVGDLHRLAARHTDLRAALKALPDLERGIARAHAGSRASKHGVMFDDSETKRLWAFIDLLAALRRALAVPALLARDAASFASRRLRALATVGDGFPDIGPLLDGVARGFDLAAARKEGSAGLVPEPGTVPEHDALAAEVAELEGKLERFLAEQRKRLKCPQVAFRTMGKDEYLLEVPVEAAKRLGPLPSGWSEVNGTKTVKRFAAAEVKAVLGPLAEARDRRDASQQDLLRVLMGRFSEHAAAWRAAVAALAEIDCLLSLSLVSFGLDAPMCRPRLVAAGPDGPVLRLRGSRHPCVVPPAGQPFIPNDVALGGAGQPPVALVTGPNMGGKSTLLRQACVAVVMAQLGCYVPAEACELSPVDRIFTRIGAADRILQGESTFMVELQETAGVLRHATRDSLVILDELGRGTSTFDGLSIAFATLQHLAAHLRCRTLFSTHYHMLTEWTGPAGGVALHHMSSLVDDGQRRVTFLYKFLPGVCPRSYGLHVARLAGLPPRVVGRAEALGHGFEAATFERRKRARGSAADEAEERCRRVARAAAAGDCSALRAALAHA